MFGWFSDLNCVKTTIKKRISFCSFLCLFFTSSVDQASDNTDIQTDKVCQRILVVSPDDHASVGDDDVLQTADDGGGEGGVVAGAEDHGEHQDEAKHAGEQELRDKYRVIPAFKLFKYILSKSSFIDGEVHQ